MHLPLGWGLTFSGRGWQTFSLKGQIVNIWGFVGHILFVPFFFSQPLKSLGPFLASLHKNKQGDSSEVPVKGFQQPTHSGHGKRAPAPLGEVGSVGRPSCKLRARLLEAWWSGFQKCPHPGHTAIHHQMSSSGIRVPGMKPTNLSLKAECLGPCGPGQAFLCLWLSCPRVQSLSWEPAHTP